MNNLTLNCYLPQNITIIPNEFLDSFMLHANGEFVKIYLLLLRMSAVGRTFSMSDAADQLSCTETDIIRALRYWEQTGLLVLKQDENGSLTDVTLAPLSAPGKSEPAAASASVMQTAAAASKPAETAPDPAKDAAADGITPASETASEPEASPAAISGGTQPAAAENSADSAPARRQLTAARLAELNDTEDFTYLLFVAGQYLGRTLTRTDIDTIGYFFDELHMSADLIEYLIEYCVGNNHKAIRYIESVGLAWHQNGISTVEEAKDASSRFNRDYFTIFKSLGIRSRSPIRNEIEIMDRWMDTYHFTMDIIQEACTRTILNTGKPTLAYADRILTHWYDENVRSLDDIRKNDEIHQLKQKNSKKEPGKKQGKAPSGSFYNFEQRSYDSSLENQLLGLSENPAASE